AFEEAIGVLEGAKAEGQIAIELRRAAAGGAAPVGAGEAMLLSRTHDAGMRGTGSIPGIVGDPGSGGEADGAQGGSISNDLVQVLHARFNAANVRGWMAREQPAFGVFVSDVKAPAGMGTVEGDMRVVEL